MILGDSLWGFSKRVAGLLRRPSDQRGRQEGILMHSPRHPGWYIINMCRVHQAWHFLKRGRLIAAGVPPGFPAPFYHLIHQGRIRELDSARFVPVISSTRNRVPVLIRKHKRSLWHALYSRRVIQKTLQTVIQILSLRIQISFTDK